MGAAGGTGDIKNWKLQISGEVKKPVTLSLVPDRYFYKSVKWLEGIKFSAVDFAAGPPEKWRIKSRSHRKFIKWNLDFPDKQKSEI